MTYLLNKSEKTIQKAALEFARGEFDKDVTRELDKESVFPETIWAKAADLGFIGTHLPEAFSGGGMGYLENVLVAESFTRSDSTTGAAIMLAGIAAEWLNRFGGEKQKNTILPEILEGRMRTGAAFTIPDSYSDCHSVTMEEVEPGIKWRMNGQIDGVLNAKTASLLVFLCTNTTVDSKVNGLSTVMVAVDKPGVRIETEPVMLGMRMTGAARVTFEDVEIAPADLIGQPTKGRKQADHVVSEFRLLLAALALGTAQGAFDRAIAHTKSREQFRKKIAQFQVTRQKIANMALKIEQARCLTYQAAALFGQKNADPRMPTMANLTANMAGVEVSFEAIQLLGGYGYTSEYDVERNYRDAKTLQILSGYKKDLNEEIAAAVIGRIK